MRNVASFGLFLLNCICPPLFIFLVRHIKGGFQAKIPVFFSALFFIGAAICSLVFPPAGLSLIALIFTVWGFSSFASICGALIGYQMTANNQLIPIKETARRLNLSNLAITTILVATTTTLLIYFTPLSIPAIMALSILATILTTLFVTTVRRYWAENMRYNPTSRDADPLFIKELSCSLGYGHIDKFLPEENTETRLRTLADSSRAESNPMLEDLASPHPKSLWVGVGLGDDNKKGDGATATKLGGSFQIMDRYYQETRTPNRSLETKTRLLPIFENPNIDNKPTSTGFFTASPQRKLLGLLGIGILIFFILAIPPITALIIPAAFSTASFQALMITAACLLLLSSFFLYKHITYQEELMHPEIISIVPRDSHHSSYTLKRVSPPYQTVYYELVIPQNDPKKNDLNIIKQTPDWQYKKAGEGKIEIFDKTLRHFHVTKENAWKKRRRALANKLGRTLDKTFAQISFDDKGKFSIIVFGENGQIVDDVQSNNRAHIKDVLKRHGLGSPQDLKRFKALGRYKVDMLTLDPSLGTQKTLADGSTLDIPCEGQGVPHISAMSQAKDITNEFLKTFEDNEPDKEDSTEYSKLYNEAGDGSYRSLLDAETPRPTSRTLDSTPSPSKIRFDDGSFYQSTTVHTHFSRKKQTNTNSGRSRDSSRDRKLPKELSPVKEESRELRSTNSTPGSPATQG